MPPPKPCVCIGCGCDDLHACEDLLGDPCSWLIQSGTAKRGVCSECPTWLRRWDKGERKLSARAKAAVAERKLQGRLVKPRIRAARW